MVIEINSGRYDLNIKNGEAVVSISNIESNGNNVFTFYASDFLHLMNVGGSAFLKTSDGYYIDIHLNLKNGHLRTLKHELNVYLTKQPKIDALKKELSSIISATYMEEKGLPW